MPSIHSISIPKSRWLSDGTLELIANGDTNKYNIIELDLGGLSCWYTDFLALKIKLSKFDNLGPFQGAELFFTNDIAQKYSVAYLISDHCQASIKPTDQEQEIIFSLRNLPAWSMGGKCRSVRIALPADCNVQIKKIWVPQTCTMMPAVNLQSNGEDQPPDEIKLDKYHDPQNVQYDASSISDCKQVVFEVAKTFEHPESIDAKDDSQIFIKKERRMLLVNLLFAEPNSLMNRLFIELDYEH